MKKLLSSSFIVSLSLFSGCDEVNSSGHVTLEPGQMVQFTDREGHPMRLVTGRLSFSIRSFLTKPPELRVQQRDQTALVSIPKDAIVSETEFFIRGSRVGLDFDMQGIRRSEEVSSRLEDRVIACTGPGYCVKPDPQTNQPKPDYYPDCPGKKGQRVRVVELRKVDKVQYLTPDNTLLANYDGAGPSYFERQEVSVDKFCHIHALY